MATESIAKQLEKALATTNKKIDQIDRAMDSSKARELGNLVREQMLNSIAKGISTVDGETRYSGYKRENDPLGYPQNSRKKFPDKRSRPVNLKLSGDFLDDLSVKLVSNKGGYLPQLGYFNPAQAIKEQGHREGANGQPKRPTLPIGRFKDWNRTITRLILNFYVDTVADYVGEK